MDQDFDILPVETSDKVRNTLTPYLQLRSNGNSYLNEKAAKLLGFTTGSLIKFHCTRDLSEWYISSDPMNGALVRKVSGLYKFCDTRTIKKVFEAFDLKCTRADFPISGAVQEKKGPDGNLISLVFIVPKPYNIV